MNRWMNRHPNLVVLCGALVVFCTGYIFGYWSGTP